MTHTSLLRSLAACGALALATLAACSGETKGPPKILDPLDIDEGTSSEITFDETTSLIAPGDFSDPSAVRDNSAIQHFFERTPYNRRSFLSTYSSNGTTAAGAVLSAALKYKINPIVLLVRLQMAQGLVALDIYPDPASRVEYAFQCGCDGEGTCLPDTAGLDRQLECVSARLASYLQQINDSVEKVTFGGWGPGLPALTLDGVTVTPADESSAALYQFDPVYGEKDKLGGAWVFNNIYLRYARAFSYGGSIDPAITGKWIGEPCTADSDCSSSIPNARCLKNFPGGYCSGECDEDCPSNPSKAQAYCATLGQASGGCVAYCNPAAPNCRDGYSCEKVDLVGDNGEQVDACTVK